MGAGTAGSQPRQVHKPFRRALTGPFVVLIALSVATAVSLAGCAQGSQPWGAPASAPNPEEPASLKIEPAPNTQAVDPVAPVSVSAQTGTLIDVAMVNDAGKPVEGVLTPDAKFWHPVVPLGYGRTYTLTITSRGPGGKTATQPSSFSTLTPPNQTKVSFQTTSEAALADGATYVVALSLSRTSTSQSATRPRPSDGWSSRSLRRCRAPGIGSTTRTHTGARSTTTRQRRR
jgi:Bacterial Ig domain